VRWSAAGELVPRSLETLRSMGVLQRIALCWGAAALIIWWLHRGKNTSERSLWWAVSALLLGYWLACLLLGRTGDPYSLQGWFGTGLDRALLGEAHLYKGEGIPFDPEGLASTVPAVAQVLLGVLAGRLVMRWPPGPELVARLFVMACVMCVLGWLWQLEFPLNKKIWSSSYVLLSSGLAMATLALLLWWLQVLRRRGPWVPFFEVFGKNALFVFVMSGLVPRVLGLLRWSDGVGAEGQPLWLSPLPWLYRSFFAGIGGDPRLGSFLFSLANLALYWALAAWLDRRRIYIRV
jgi:predicted acyltransferase